MPLTETQCQQINFFHGIGFVPKLIAQNFGIPIASVRAEIRKLGVDEKVSPTLIAEVLELSRLGLTRKEIARRLYEKEWRIKQIHKVYIGRLRGKRGTQMTLAVKRELKRLDRENSGTCPPISDFLTDQSGNFCETLMGSAQENLYVAMVSRVRVICFAGKWPDCPDSCLVGAIMVGFSKDWSRIKSLDVLENNLADAILALKSWEKQGYRLN